MPIASAIEKINASIRDVLSRITFMFRCCITDTKVKIMEVEQVVIQVVRRSLDLNTDNSILKRVNAHRNLLRAHSILLTSSGSDSDEDKYPKKSLTDNQ
jgi:hypothetical protein